MSSVDPSVVRKKVMKYDSHAVMYMHLNCLYHVLHHSDVVFKLCSFVCCQGEDEEVGPERQKQREVRLMTHFVLVYRLRKTANLLVKNISPIAPLKWEMTMT